LDYKPTSILKFCAETSVGIDNIKWLTWNAEGATGKGIYQINDCQPSCEVGKYLFAEIEIILSKGKVIDGKRALTFITIKSANSEPLPLSDSPKDAWPLELAG
jgi:hypothetical protein